jgi:DNA-binding HxlR family transcriptional regulator
MYQYGQYCPIAKAAEILGDRWTLLIVRDLLLGTHHFNALERGLPGISRGLLAERLRRLERMGIIAKRENPNDRKRTEYIPTQAGLELQAVIQALLVWGAQWAFEEPSEADLDPVLLMWWMRDGVVVENLPDERVVVQFDFPRAQVETYWLVMQPNDVSLCLTHPGHEIDVLVTADLAVYLQVWLGRMEFAQAIASRRVTVDGIPALANAFPTWFQYSLAAPTVRAAMQKKRNIIA